MDHSDSSGIALWPAAQDEARRCCGETLRRLRRGEGGFYAEDDFWQDLAVEFLELSRRAASPEALWAAWRLALAHGGARVLKRAPQRLWAGGGVERPTDPAALELELAPAEADPTGDGDAPLPPAIRAELAAPSEGLALEDGLALLDALEEGLAALPLGQRQLLYMSAVLGHTSEELAALCGLPDKLDLRQRLRRARAVLRKGVGGRVWGVGFGVWGLGFGVWGVWGI